MKRRQGYRSQARPLWIDSFDVPRVMPTGRHKHSGLEPRGPHWHSYRTTYASKTSRKLSKAERVRAAEEFFFGEAAP